MASESPFLLTDLREFIWRRTDAVFQLYALDRPPLRKYYKEMNNFLKLLESEAPHAEIRRAFELMEEADNVVNGILTFATYWQGFCDGLMLLQHNPLAIYEANIDED